MEKLWAVDSDDESEIEGLLGPGVEVRGGLEKGSF
jgi:hypothetical protein